MNPRIIAISSGLITFFLVAIMFSIFGLNVITGAIGFFIFVFFSPISSIKTGLKGSDKLLENMTNSQLMSQDSKNEWNKINLGRSSEGLKLNQNILSKNPDEIILPVLLPILKKNFPEEVVFIFKENINLLYGTPYYAYAFLLLKWGILSTRSDFYSKTLREKQRHLIFDRGAGNDTRFSPKEIEEIMNKDVENAVEAILEIVKFEQFEEDNHFGGDIEESWIKFMNIAPEIKNKIMQVLKIESLD